MVFSPSGDGSVSIDLEANDNASRDINKVKDALDRLGNTRGVSSGLNRVAEAIDDASDQMADVLAGATAAGAGFQVLQGRADEAADEIDDVGDQSSQTSRSLMGLGASSQSTAGAMAALATVSAVSLVPTLAALSTTLVPLVATMGALGTALGGVAAGFAGVIGTGAFAYGKKLSKQNKERLAQTKTEIQRLQTLQEETGGLTTEQQKQLKSLKQQKKELEEATTVMGALSKEFDPVREQLAKTATELGTQFIPLIRDAIDALPQFIRNVQGAIGPLQPFADALRNLGSTAFNVFPEIVEQVLNMGREILPAFTRFTNNVMRGVVPALKAMDETASEVIPLFKGIGSAIVELMPAINEFGLMILEEMVPRLRTAINTFIDLNERTDGWLLKSILLVSAISTVVSALGTLGTAISGAVSAVTAIVGVLGGPLTLALLGVGATIAGLWYAWNNNLGNIQGKTNKVVNNVTAWFSQFSDEVDSIEATVKSSFNQVVNSFSVLSDEANSMWKSIKSAFTLTEGQTKETANSVETLLAGVEAAIETVGNVISWVVKNHYQPMMQRIAKLTKVHLGPTVDEFIETFNVIVDRLRWFVGIFQTLWARYGDEIMAIIKPILKSLRIVFGQVFDTIFTLIRVTLNLIQGDWEEAWTTIEAFFKRTSERLQSLFTTLGNALEAAWELLVTVLEDAWDALWNYVEKKLNQAWDSMVSFITGIGKDDIYNAFYAVGQAIRGVFTTLFNWVTGAGGALAGFIGDIASYVKNDAKSDTKGAFKSLLDAGRTAFNNFVTDVIGAGGTIKSMVGDIASYLKTGAWEDLKNAAEVLVGGITSAFEGLYDGLIGNSLVPDMIEDITEYLKNEAKDLIEDAGEEMWDALEDAVDSTIDGPSINWPDVPDWLAWDGSDWSLASAVNLDNNNNNNNDDSNNNNNNNNNSNNDSGNDDDDGDGGTTVPPDPVYPGGNVPVPENPRGAHGLATGGIVTDPLNAVIGEGAESEAVMPLDKLSSVLDTQYEAGVNAGAGGGNMTVTLRVEGDDQLAEIIRDNAEVVVEENENAKQDRVKRFR